MSTINVPYSYGWRRYTHYYFRIPVVDDEGVAFDLSEIDLRLTLSKTAGGEILRTKTTADGNAIADPETPTTALIEWGGDEVEELEEEYDDLPAAPYWIELYDDTAHLMLGSGIAVLGEGSAPA